MRTLLLALLPGIAFASPLTHQGRLLDAAGDPINGAVDLQFTLTDDSDTTIHTEVFVVDVQNGFYAVELGADAANPLSDAEAAQARWIAIAADGLALGSPTAIRSVPSAQFAQAAGDAQTAVTAQTASSATTATTATTATVAQSVSGGVVDASDVRIGGDVVINSSGDFVGDVTLESLQGLGCGANQMAVRGASSWSCMPIPAGVDAGQTCPSGQLSRGSDSAGNLLCAVDANTTYSGSTFALSNRSCAANQYMRGIQSNGLPLCVNLETAINTYLRNHCYIYLGWRDSVNGNNSPPSKYGRALVSNGGTTPSCNVTGGDTDCTTATLYGQSVRLVAINTDGTVNGDDKFYAGMYCIP